MNVSKYVIKDKLILLDRLFLEGDEIYIEGSDPVSAKPQRVFLADRTLIGDISNDYYWKVVKKLDELQKTNPKEGEQ